MTILWLIVLLAFIAGALYLIYCLRRNTRIKYLKGDYKNCYIMLENSLNSTYISTSEKKNVSMDLAALLFEAQQKGKPVENVIGKDHDGFINRLVSELGYKRKFWFIMISGVQYFILALMISQLAIYYARPTDSFFEATLGFVMFPFIAVLAFAVVPLVKHFLMKARLWLAVLVPLLFVGLYFISRAILHGLFDVYPWLFDLYDSEYAFVSTINSLIAVLCIFASTFVLQYILHRRVYRLI